MTDDVFQQNVAGLEAFTGLQKANMMAEFAVGLAKKEMSRVHRCLRLKAVGNEAEATPQP
jgi:hypothetical protein